jgi:heme A synthase
MDIELLFGVEKILGILVATLAITAFCFTIKYRRFYSCWARSSILVGGIVSIVNITGISIWSTDVHIQMVVTHIGMSLSMLLFIYTILRFKWGLLKQYRKIVGDAKDINKNIEVK